MSNVWIPLPAMNVPAFVIPPRNVAAEFPVLSHVAPDAIVTDPVKILVPVEDEIKRSPPTPDPMEVIPETIKSESATVKVPALPIERLPLIFTDPDEPVKEPPEISNPLLKVCAEDEPR